MARWIKVNYYGGRVSCKQAPLNPRFEETVTREQFWTYKKNVTNDLWSQVSDRASLQDSAMNAPERVIEGVHLPPIEGDVLLGVVSRRARSEGLRDGFLHVWRVVLRERALFPGASVALERTLRSIITFTNRVGTLVKQSRTPCLQVWVKLILSFHGETKVDSLDISLNKVSRFVICLVPARWI